MVSFSGGQKTIFLVNSVPLVTQQKDYLSRHLDVQCISLCGGNGVDDWKEDKWLEVIENNQVMLGVDINLILSQLLKLAFDTVGTNTEIFTRINW